MEVSVRETVTGYAFEYSRSISPDGSHFPSFGLCCTAGNPCPVCPCTRQKGSLINMKSIKFSYQKLLWLIGQIVSVSYYEVTQCVGLCEGLRYHPLLHCVPNLFFPDLNQSGPLLLHRSFLTFNSVNHASVVVCLMRQLFVL